jgi:hypothetical protein
MPFPFNPSQNSQNFRAIKKEEEKYFVFILLDPAKQIRSRFLKSTLAKKTKLKARRTG